MTPFTQAAARPFDQVGSPGEELTQMRCQVLEKGEPRHKVPDIHGPRPVPAVMMVVMHIPHLPVV